MFGVSTLSKSPEYVPQAERQTAYVLEGVLQQCVEGSVEKNVRTGSCAATTIKGDGGMHASPPVEHQRQRHQVMLPADTRSLGAECTPSSPVSPSAKWVKRGNQWILLGASLFTEFGLS